VVRLSYFWFMATFNELAYNIKNIAAAGLGTSDDSRLNIRQIKFWIRTYRAKLINQITDFGKDIHPNDVQDLGILTLDEIDKADPNCVCDPSWGCVIKKVEIPSIVSFPEMRALLFVGKIDKQTPFVVSKADVVTYKQQTRFGSLYNRAYLIGTRLYVILTQKDCDMEYINVRGVFENPTSVDYFDPETCESRCFDDALDRYPMSEQFVSLITEEIMQKELNITLQTPNDELNDAREQKAPIP